MAITVNTARNLRVLPFFSIQTPVRQIARVRRTLTEWKCRWSYRRDLERLLRGGEYLVRDIGLTLQDACQEIDKPFWRP